MKGEIWKDIEGYEGYYQISNMGRVKSLERTVWNSGLNGGCYVTIPEKIMKGVADGHDYLQVKLYKDGKDKKCRINRLVASAFLENPQNLPEVNHKNEDKTDNRVENLEWCSSSYNINYGARNKKVAEKLKGRKLSEEHKKKIGKKNSKPVFSVNKESGLIMWWQSANEAEKCTGINKNSICACLKGRQKSAGGHYWFYADDDNE